MNVLNIVTGFAIALVLSIILTPLILRLSTVYGLFDEPDLKTLGEMGRRIHLKPIPRLGGIAIVLAFFITNLVPIREQQIPSVLLLSLFIFIVGAIDDIRPISARLRFVTQITIAAITVYVGEFQIHHLNFSPLFTVETSYWIGGIIAVFIIVGAINALNMIDGLDGLAGGISIIALSMLSFQYYLITRDTEVITYLTIPAVGSILGFLRYNTYPASIFMGDNGSNWLGYIIGIHILIVLTATPITSPITTQQQFIRDATNIPLISVLLCFAVPIFDTASVIIRRIATGHHPMNADKRHIHHSLIRLGLNQTQSVTFIYFIAIATSILGILPIAYTKYSLEWAPYLGIALILTFLHGSAKIKWSGKYQNPFKYLYYSSGINTKKLDSLINRLLFNWERMNKYCLFLILTVTPAFSGSIPKTIGLAAIPILILTIGHLIFKTRSNDFIESMVVTLSCIVLLAANNQSEIKVELLGEIHHIQSLYNSLFYFLFFSSILFLATTIKKNYLVLTPSDFLMLTIPILLLLFPEEVKQAYRLDTISMRSFIVFLGYRTLEKRRTSSRRHLKIATMMALIYVIMVSLLQMKLVY